MLQVAKIRCVFSFVFGCSGYVIFCSLSVLTIYTIYKNTNLFYNQDPLFKGGILFEWNRILDNISDF